jgi:hypothetical protein
MKKQIQNQRALLELLDQSDIAVGNVGVPTCFGSDKQWSTVEHLRSLL